MVWLKMVVLVAPRMAGIVPLLKTPNGGCRLFGSLVGL